MFPRRTGILTMLRPRRRRLSSGNDEDSKSTMASLTKRSDDVKHRPRNTICRKRALEMQQENKDFNRYTQGENVTRRILRRDENQEENSSFVINMRTLSGSCFNQYSESLENLRNLAESSEMDDYIRICGVVGENARTSRRRRTSLSTNHLPTHIDPDRQSKTDHVTFKHPPPPSSDVAKFAKRRRIQTTKSLSHCQAAARTPISSSQVSSKGQNSPNSRVGTHHDGVKRYLDDYLVVVPSMGTTVKEMKRRGKVRSHRRSEVNRVMSTPRQFQTMEERCKFYWDSNLDSDSDLSSDDEKQVKCSSDSRLQCSSKDVGVNKMEDVPVKNRSPFRKIVINNSAHTPAPKKTKLSLLPPTQTPLKSNKRAPIYFPADNNDVTISGALVDYSFSDTESTCASRDWDAVLGMLSCQSAVANEDDAMESFMNSKLLDNSDSDEGLSSMNSVDFFTV